MKNHNKEIPKSFMLGGIHYKTVFKDIVISINEENEVQVGGISDGVETTIEIASKVDESICSSDYQRQTFYHELVHQILDILGEELSADEEFVQRFSVLLDQFEQTKKF